MASHTPGAPVFAAPAELPDWALRSVDLANPRLGAKTLASSDDFFAEVAVAAVLMSLLGWGTDCQ